MSKEAGSMKGQFALTKAQEMLQKTVRRMAEEEIAPRVNEIEETGVFPQELWDLFRKQQLIGLSFPKEYGGGGADKVSLVIVMEELARVFADALMWCYQPHLGASPILVGGNEEQKRRFVPPIASGEKMCAFALTEPEAGSDVASMRTTAVRDGDYYVLNGSKRFISFGGSAPVMTVFAKTDPAAKHRGISAFFLDKEQSSGVSQVRLERKLGWRSTPTAELVLTDCRIPRENLLGQEGQGWDIAMKTLDIHRVGNGACGVGIAQGAYEVALNYAQERVQFGAPIASFQAIQFKLADMATEIEAARLLTYKAAVAVDEDSPLMAKLGAMAKCFATDVAMRVSVEAVQILGGSGYMKDFATERYFREAKLTQIFAGTNEIQRLTIGREILRELGSQA
jgi:alkylation response protein AidB-like acyl-CoA dehydrogenase